MTAEVAAMTEDELLTGLVEAMTLAGWRWTHARRSDKALMMGSAGLPDILAIPPMHRGPVLAIETKSAGGRLSEDQATWMVRLLQAGVTAAVVRPDDYDRALELILAGVSDRDAWAWGWQR